MTDQKPNLEVLLRETEHILPELINRLWGNGGFRIDTDTLSLPEDYDKLEWLSRIVAGFVLRERELWKPGYQEAMVKYGVQRDRMNVLDGILGRAREASQKEDVTVDELRTILSKYRNPVEDYYDKRNRGHDLVVQIFGADSPEAEHSANFGKKKKTSPKDKKPTFSKPAGISVEDATYPGEYLQALMVANKVSVPQMATLTDLTNEWIRYILDGSYALNDSLCRTLERVTNIPTSTWQYLIRKSHKIKNPATETNYAVHPGEFLKEWLQMENLTASKAAKIASDKHNKPFDKHQLVKVFVSHQPVTPEIAVFLEEVTQIPAKAWLGYQELYDKDVARLS